MKKWRRSLRKCNSLWSYPRSIAQATCRKLSASMAKINRPGTWEVILVDNNSSDATAQVVSDARPNFPVELRYLFEPQAGRSAALNAGIKAAQGSIVATRMTTCGLNRIGCSKLQRRWNAISAILSEEKFCRFGELRSPRGSPTRRATLGCDRPAGFRAGSAGVRQTVCPAGSEYGFQARGIRPCRAMERRNRPQGRDPPGTGGARVDVTGPGCRVERDVCSQDGVHHVIPCNRFRSGIFAGGSIGMGSAAPCYISNAPSIWAHGKRPASIFPRFACFSAPLYMYRSCLAGNGLGQNGAEWWKIASFEHELAVWFFLGVLRQRWKDRHQPSGEGKDSGNLAGATS